MAQALQCPSCGAALDPDRRACPHCGVTTASRRCGVCFDLSLVQDRNCRRCGARLPREDSQARPERLSCPGCASPMTPRRLAQSSFDECDACGGLWLSPDASTQVATEAETRTLLAPFDLHGEADSPSTSAGKIVYRRCPICARMMNRSQYAAGSGVVLDQCKDHGSYYDRGELTRIFAFIEGGGLEKARRREAEALRQDLRDLRRKAIASAAEGGAGGMGGFGMEEPAGGWSRLDALDLIRWIAGYFGGKRPANSG